MYLGGFLTKENVQILPDCSIQDAVQQDILVKTLRKCPLFSVSNFLVANRISNKKSYFILELKFAGKCRMSNPIIY